MRIFKTKPFARFARKERIGDAALGEAVARAESGLVDADLGGGVIKQRIARPGKGRSGGYRTIIVFRKGARSVFVYGFAKSARRNIEDDELGSLKEAASFWLSANEEQIEQDVMIGNLQEN
ncbi:MAG TPA: type II toxin-antitoxin system RelE/ParE family toxin [Rhizomicrobium sp.]